jgi:predicted Fe-Mo cluster-binding NifX family protein
MKICIPTETGDGVKAKMCGHFGSAPYFTIYDNDQETFEIIDNTNRHHVHGSCNPIEIIDGNNVEAVICGGIGVRALQKLNARGIKTLKSTAQTVEEIIKQSKECDPEEFTVENACNQHNCQ